MDVWRERARRHARPRVELRAPGFVTALRLV